MFSANRADGDKIITNLAAMPALMLRGALDVIRRDQFDENEKISKPHPITPYPLQRKLT